MKKVRLFGMIALVCACLAVALLTNIPAWLKYKKGDIKDLDTVAKNSLQEGDLVKGTFNRVLGACAEEYSTKFGIRTSSKSSKLYYVIWMENENFILYETGNSKEYDTLDQMTDELDKYYESLTNAQESGDLAEVKLPTTTMEFEGRVTTLTSSIKGYFKEWYDDVFDDGEFNDCTETVIISRADFSNYSMTIYIGFGAAAAAIALLVVTLIVWRKEKEYSY